MYKAIILVTLFLMSFVGSAQIVEKIMTMSSGEQNGLEVDLKADSKASEKIWKETVKPYGKTDWDRKNKEHVLFNVRIPSISSGDLTIVTRFNQYQSMTKGSFWIKSDGDFLNSEEDSEIIRSVGEFLQQYAYDVERHGIREDLKNKEKSLGRYEKDLAKLEKKNKNLHKDIEKAKAEIAKKEREIEENLKSQEDKKREIVSQKDKIQQTTVSLTTVGKA